MTKADFEAALKHRGIVKSKKPYFTRQESHKKTRIGESWRRPRGAHSKVRKGYRGRKRSPEPGWGSPRIVKGLHKSGLEQVNVETLSVIEKIDPKKQGIVIASNVGSKKRIELVKSAIEKGIRIFNIRDAKEWLAKAEKGFAERKQVTKTGGEELVKKENEAKSVASAAEKSQKTDPEEMKKLERIEKEKVLTKRE